MRPAASQRSASRPYRSSCRPCTARRRIVDRGLERCQLCLGLGDRRLVGRCAGLGVVLCCELRVEVQLSRMHRPRSCARPARDNSFELCQCIVCGICCTLPAILRQAASTADPASDDGSLNSARDPLHTVERQDFASLNCRWRVAPNCSRSQTGYETASGLVQTRDANLTASQSSSASRVDMACRSGQRPGIGVRWIGTNRSRGASPASASTSSARAHLPEQRPWQPSNTLTTQSLHPGPRTAQSSQSMVTAPVSPASRPSDRPLHRC